MTELPLPEELSRPQRLRTLLALALIFAFACLLRWPVAAIPLERDEGEYAYIAQRWLLGEVPYRSAFDQKPPGAFAVYAVIEACLGTSPTAIHWGMQLYTLGTLALIFFLGRKLFSPLVGLLAALLAAFLTTAPALLGNAANTEIFMLLPATAGIWAALRARETEARNWVFATGLFSAAALLFKQVALFQALFCCALVLQTAPKRRPAIAALLTGAAAVAAPVLLYFNLAGAGAEFFDCTLGYNIGHASELPWQAYGVLFLHTALPIAQHYWPILLLAFAGLAWICLPNAPGVTAASRRGGLIVAAWLGFAFLGVIPGGYFYAHYYIQVVPPLALLAGHGAVSLASFRPMVRFRAAAAGLLAAAAIVYGMAASERDRVFFMPGSPDQKARLLYGANPFPESPELGRFIAEHTQPDDTVFILGSEPQVYYYAQRKSASRYIIAYPLFKNFPDTRQRQREVLRELETNRPAIFVNVKLLTSTTPAPHHPTDLEAAARAILVSEYRPVAYIPARRPLGAGPGRLVPGRAGGGERSGPALGTPKPPGNAATRRGQSAAGELQGGPGPLVISDDLQTYPQELLLIVFARAPQQTQASGDPPAAPAR